MKIREIIKRTIASNIKRARIDSNMTQAEAAAKLGITAQAISNFERGVNGIENSLLLRMCEIYNTSMSRILGEDDEHTQKAPTDGERSITDDEIKFALFRGREDITDAMYEEVLNFAEYVARREEDKRKVQAVPLSPSIMRDHNSYLHVAEPVLLPSVEKKTDKD